MFYLNYTKSINIIADNKNTATTSTANEMWILRYSEIYGQNAGDIYFYCGWIGCIESNPLIEASNANSLNLTCNGFYACAANEIYCPNNGPRGNPATNINIVSEAQNPLISNTFYAVEQFNDVIFNCIGTCVVDGKGNKLKCNPNYSSECNLVNDGLDNIYCPVPTILNPPECTTYLLPTLSPTETPTSSPTIFTISPTITPTTIPSITPTLFPTYSPTFEPTIFSFGPTIFPTETPTLLPSTETLNPTKTPIYSSTQNKGDRIITIKLNNLVLISISLILFLIFSIACASFCIYSHVKRKRIKTEIQQATIISEISVSPHALPTTEGNINDNIPKPKNGLH